MSGRERASEIEAAAARWVWRLDRDGRSPELEAELEAWLDGDSRRRGAFLHAEATWSVLDRGAQLAGVPAWALEPRPKRSLPRRALLIGGGAAIAASAAAVVRFGQGREHYGTQLGEIRRVPLTDGSTAAINTESTLDVAMSPQTRLVRLNKGEAWFQVAKNPQRPFVVAAGEVRVRAVGTAFSVRRRAGGVEVLVTEGAVETWREGAESRKVLVSAGAMAFVSETDGAPRQLSQPLEVERQLAWRAGRIDLAGETLGEAVAEFNRYNSRKLVVADADLAQKRLYGVFRTDDPDGFAASVRLSFGGGVSVAAPP